MNSKRRKIKPDARSLALEALMEILEEGAFANITVNRILHENQLSGPERGLFTQLVYGVTRMQNTLDWFLAQLVAKNLTNLTRPIRNILRLGTYQILYLEKIPFRAAVNESVELAKIFGHAGVARLVNGVLRNLIRKKEEIKFPPLETQPVLHIALKYSHPEWLVEKWLQQFGVKETIDLCGYNNSPANLSIRTNTLKITRAELQSKLQKQGVVTRFSSWVPEGLIIEEWEGLDQIAEFKKGFFLLQDEGSMLVAHALRPEAGSTVVDACAAPGTKTTHLVQLMENRGHVFAYDIHSHKLELIKDNCQRLGINIVKWQLGDARTLGDKIPDQVDYLLVDAPCSGTGVLGRRADSRWRKTPEQLVELPRLQLEILNAVASSLKPGGVLVYSTCSIAQEENQQVIHNFLEANEQIKLEDLTSYLPFALDRQEDLETARKGYLQILPQLHGIDGFYLARLRKHS